MAFQERVQKFGNTSFTPDGWYWLLTSASLKIGQAVPAKFLNQELVVFRGADGKARALEAHCPHMGAHLCDGKIEGNEIRCPFHRWKFNEAGICTDIPAQADTRIVRTINKFKLDEKYGLIWLWQGEDLDQEPLPVIPELAGQPLDSRLGTPFVKGCHPNVMMINAIDAHHFRSVHQLVVDLDLKPQILSPRCIQFSNQTPIPQKNLFLRWASRFYAGALTYQMTYWWGHTGSVTVGPDFLHFYLMFTLRPTLDGKAEGQTILVTPARPGWKGVLLNPILLFLSRCVGNYFAKGDTQIFSRIKFNFQTPIRSDLPIIKFIEHYEQMNKSKDVKVWSPNEIATL